MESFEESFAAKRGRLTCRDMQQNMQTGGPSSAKIELADGVKVKKAKNAKQEISFESQAKEKMEMDDLWLWVKREIKEEIEQEEHKKQACKSSNLDDLSPEDIVMKEEMEEELKHMEDASKLKADEDCVWVWEMHLGCSDLTIQNGIGTTCLLKLPFFSHKANSTDERVKRRLSGSYFLCSLPSLDPLQISAQDSANPEESSLDAFASHAATWAKQCLAFRSSKTWSPTRPCCAGIYSQ